MDWREIPGNTKVLEDLTELLASGEATGFIGAGASAGLYPLWSGLLEILVDAAVDAGKADAEDRRIWLKMDALQAAQQIRGELGEGTFIEQIQQTFGPRTGPDGKRFTVVHGVLSRLNFRALVTTNYDPSLTLACREHRPDLLVKDFHWREDAVTRWLQGRQGVEGELPILHAHGRYDDRESLVLDAEGFRLAYTETPYRELFEQLWLRERMLFVGFGFSDPWFRILCDQVLSRAEVRNLSAPRHFAVLGLPERNLRKAVRFRKQYEDQYHLRALFYPVKVKEREKLGSGQFIPGFEEQVVGANIDDDVTVNVTFPEGYGNEKLSGQDAVFEVKVKDIEETVAAEIDDALAEKLGEENLEKLKERVAEQVKAEYDRIAHSHLKREVLDQLADNHDFDVPEAMVEAEFDGIWKQIEADKEQGKLDEEDAAKSEDELKAEYQDIAVRRVRLGLLLSEVGSKNEIDVTQEELNAALLQEARNYPGQEQAVFEFYQKNPQALANLRAPVFEDKVVDYIVDLAKVTEKSISPDDLRKQIEAENEAVTKKKPAKKAAAKKAPAKKPAKKAAAKKADA